MTKFFTYWHPTTVFVLDLPFHPVTIFHGSFIPLPQFVTDHFYLACSPIVDVGCFPSNIFHQSVVVPLWIDVQVLYSFNHTHVPICGQLFSWGTITSCPIVSSTLYFMPTLRSLFISAKILQFISSACLTLICRNSTVRCKVCISATCVQQIASTILLQLHCSEKFCLSSHAQMSLTYHLLFHSSAYSIILLNHDCCSCFSAIHNITF